MEFISQREGAVALELLGELDGAVRGVLPVAFPALGALARVASAVAAQVHHVQHVLLRPAAGPGAVVVRTVDIQIVVHVHLHRVALSPQAGDKGSGSEKKPQRSKVFFFPVTTSQTFIRTF